MHLPIASSQRLCGPEFLHGNVGERGGPTDEQESVQGLAAGEQTQGTNRGEIPEAE